MPGLSLQHLVSGYGDTAIVKDVSLEVGPKETVVIMGPSGCGKSTLFLTILGIVTARRGRIVLDDQDITALPIETRNIGYLPQAKDYGLFPHMNALENVAYGLRVRGVSKPERGNRVQQLLELVNLPGYGTRGPEELSGGERQRVGIARALAIEPRLLLLDEPLSNVDQVTKLEVASHLRDLFRKVEMPVLLVTHNHEDAVFLAQRLAIMIDGKIEQVGTVKEVSQSPKTDFIKRLLMPFGDREPQAEDHSGSRGRTEERA